jgi:hypothetical protein
MSELLESFSSKVLQAQPICLLEGDVTMLGAISSISSSFNVQRYPAVQTVPSPSKGTNTSNEDTVQLSNVAQQAVKARAAAAAAPQSITEIIKEAADGDISALAQLVLVA